MSQTFPTSSCIAPPTSTPNSICGSNLTDGGGNLILTSTNIIVEDDGSGRLTVTSPVIFNDPVVQQLIESSSSYSATTASTPLDFSLGNNFNVNLAATTAFSFTNVVADKYMPFRITTEHDPTTNVYGVTFDAGTNMWYREGQQSPIYTTAANAKDMTFGFVDRNGNIFTFVNANNYKIPTGTLSGGVNVVDLSDTRRVQYNLKAVPKGKTPAEYLLEVLQRSIMPLAVTPGGICANDANGNVVNTDVATDNDSTFTSTVTLANIKCVRMAYTYSILTSAPSIVLNVNNGSIYELTVDQDIAISTVLMASGYSGLALVFATHDATTNTYTMTFPGVTTNGIVSNTNTADGLDLFVFDVSAATSVLVARINFG